MRLKVALTLFYFLFSGGNRLPYLCHCNKMKSIIIIIIFKPLIHRELTLQKGDVVYIHRQVDANWYEGEHHGRVGIFPTSYVEVCLYVCKSNASHHLLFIYTHSYVFFSDYSSNREAHTNKVSHRPGAGVWRGCSPVQLQCRPACGTVLQKGTIYTEHLHYTTTNLLCTVDFHKILASKLIFLILNCAEVETSLNCGWFEVNVLLVTSSICLNGELVFTVWRIALISKVKVFFFVFCLGGKKKFEIP